MEIVEKTFQNFLLFSFLAFGSGARNNHQDKKFKASEIICRAPEQIFSVSLLSALKNSPNFCRGCQQ